MLSTITILTALSFAAMYPLCFLISADDPLKNKFHKFHLGLPNTVGGVVLVFIWFTDIPLTLKIAVTIWKAIFLFVSRFSWKKEYPNPWLIAIPCVFGMFVFTRVQAHFVGSNGNIAFIGILASLIFCAVLYAMNLGHWYLNVHGLPIKHLMRAITIFGALLLIRLIWDIFELWTGTILFRGDILPLMRFISSIDGFLMWIGLFFGTVFPLVSLYFAKEVLKLKNIQSATGILYVILCSVLIGDIAYKYYLLNYGIVL